MPSAPYQAPEQVTAAAEPIALAFDEARGQGLARMGYTAAYFQHAVQHWFDEGWLRPGQRLIDFGAQEFFADAAAVRESVAAFLQQHGRELAPGEGLPGIQNVYEAVGLDYLSIDVDGAHGSTFFDLNTFAAPAEWRGAFDFVNNEGTIEHLANPLNGFHVAHDIAKVGGVIRHNFPLVGWAQHGFANLTPKFYAQLIGSNAYEVLMAVATLSEPTPFNDSLFATCYAADRSDGLTTKSGIPVPAVIAPPLVANIWGQLIYRKTHDGPFTMPVDHVEGSDAAAVRQRLVENYRLEAMGRLTAAGLKHPPKG